VGFDFCRAQPGLERPLLITGLFFELGQLSPQPDVVRADTQPSAQ
jgi:hypothetical protein